MLRAFFLLASLVVLPGVAVAADYRGVSAFAAMSPRYPCDALLATTDFSPRPAIAILYESFGLDHTCVHRFMIRYADKPHLVQVHFTNEVCRRNGNCSSYETFHPELSVSAYNRLLEEMSVKTQIEISLRLFFLRSTFEPAANEHTRLILGAGLEDNYSSKAFENLVKQFRANGWDREVSRNRHKGGHSLSGADAQEFHSLTGRKQSLPCLANEDGNYNQSKSASKKFLKRYGNCEAVFLWRAEHQGRSSGGRRIPPRDRSFKYTAKDVVELGGLLK